MTLPQIPRPVALLALFLILAPASAAALDVPITVHNDLGQGRSGEPITVGVPFPPGAVGDVGGLAVLKDGSTNVGPIQARALSTWWDGTPRWVLFDFPVDVNGNGTALYTITDGTSPLTSGPLSLNDTGSSYEIETGVLRVVISKSSFRIVEQALLDADGNGSYETTVVSAGASKGLVVTGTDGTEYVAYGETPTVVEIEEQGAARITIKVAGELKPASGGAYLLRYTTRVSLFAGSGRIRVQQTLTNPRAGSLGFGGLNEIAFRDARIELSTPISGASAVLGGEEGASESYFTGLGAGGRAYLYQDSSGKSTWNKHQGRGNHKNVSFRGWRAVLDDGGVTELGQGDQGSGWLDLRGSEFGVAVGIKEFWQNYPNAVEGQGSGLVMARFFPDQWASDHSLRGGEQKTHMVEFDFHGPGENGAQVGARMTGYLHPMMALATPRWYRDSRAFKRFLPRDDSPYTDYENLQRATIEGYGNRSDHHLQQNHDSDDVYGWLDWGDNYAEYEHEGDRSNLENDFSYGMILQMVRSENIHWWEFIAPGARQVSDIDVYHTQDDLGWRNGGFFEHDRTGQKQHRGKYPQPNHYNSHGMITYYYMTGDEVAHDSFMEIAENAIYRAYDPNGYSYIGHEEHRSAGWLFDASLEAWKLTKEDRWRDLCLYIVDKTHVDTKCYQDGGTCDDSEIWHNKNYVTIWHVGILMTFIGQFQEELFLQSGSYDARATSFLRGWSDFINTYMWLPAEGTFGKGYNWKHDRTSITFVDSGPVNGIRICDGLATASIHLNDPSILVNAEQAFLTSTRSPWFVGSPVTYADVKVQATGARNGHVYMSLYDEAQSNCLRVQTTVPTSGGEAGEDGVVSLFFDRGVDAASIESNLSIQGDATGSFGFTANWVNAFLVSLQLSPLPQQGENISLTLGSGAISAAGDAIDGNRDGTCGDPYNLAFTGFVPEGGIDLVAPAAVNDLRLEFHEENGSARLAWSAPADDGPLGRPSQILVRFTTTPSSESFVWDDAQDFQTTVEPLNPGQDQELYLGYIDASSGSLRAVIKTVDAAGNVSIESNQAIDTLGPQVYDQSGGAIQVAEGSSGLLRIIAVDSGRGNGRVIELRLAVDGTPLADGEILALEDAGFNGSVGQVDYVLDTAGWSVGQTHAVRYEARDDAGNWSDEFGQVAITVIDPQASGDCLHLVGSQPAQDASVPSLRSVILNFDKDVNAGTVVPNAIIANYTPVGGSSRALGVTVDVLSTSGVRINLSESLSERGSLSLRLSESILGNDGTPLGAGAACDPLPPLIIEIDPSTGTAPCLNLVQTTPVAGASQPGLSEITLTFSDAVDRASVNSNSIDADFHFDSGGTSKPGLSFDWITDAVVRVGLSPPLGEAGELVLHLSDSIASTGGAGLGEGEDCDALGELSFFVGSGKGAYGGTDLGNQASASGSTGLMAVAGYQVIFSELEPGDTLFVYDTTGYLLHEAKIDSDNYTLDTSTLGSFPNKQFIVAYRGKQQHIMAGRDVSFYRSYIGDVE